MTEDVAQTFERLYREWRAATRDPDVSLSSADDPYVDNPEFRAIVALGRPGVPPVLAKLDSDAEAHFLVHALEPMTGKRFDAEELRAAERRYGSPLGNQGRAAMWRDWWREAEEA